MSNPVSALNGATDAQGLVEIAELGPQGMLTLRGNLADRTLCKVVTALFEVTVPNQREAVADGAKGAAWMSPDELLLMCVYKDADEKAATLQERLKDQHALVVNVSDARAVFELKGPHVRDVVAKLAPVDMHSEVFHPGMFRRSRFAQVPAAFWMPEEGTVRLICFRSVAQYMFDLLKIAAQPGSEVGHLSVQ